ncbi:alginate O-acetyltransferase AlgX-related protein [Azospirillum largimobile]
MRAMTLGIVHSTLLQKLWIGLFLVLLLLPMIGQIESVGTGVTATEMRAPNALPGLPNTVQEFSVLPQRFEAWLKDHFGFRNQLVLANNLIRVKVFGQSTSPLVVLGRNGWLFYTGEHALEQTRGIDRFSPEELDRWIDVMERRQAWLAERGIPMLMVAIPNKERVYREDLPAWATQVNPESRMDQIARRLAERRSPLVFKDMTADLVAARKDMKVYFQADTHWTAEAAFAIGYRRIAEWIRSVRPDFTPLTQDDMKRVHAMRQGADLDLARMLGLAAVYEEEEVRYELLGQPKLRSNDTSMANGIVQSILRADRPNAPTVVWFRDSFTIAMYPYIAESFSKAVVTEHKGLRFDKALIEEHKPDVVVYQFVERSFNSPIPSE